MESQKFCKVLRGVVCIILVTGSTEREHLHNLIQGADQTSRCRDEAKKAKV